MYNLGVNKPPNKKKVFVGMSGGVDSSVSAALLKRAGWDVTGVFIKVWQPDWIECGWREERLEAMRAAAHLDIPFVTIDFEEVYKRGVIDYMISEYSAGRTPNPDVMCNREVKFGAFWEWAKREGASHIATGHYARNERGHLLVSKDGEKDQSYFLWTLTAADLEHLMFPVGGMPKSEVRALARRFGLPNAGKKDSQGLCFIGKVDVKEFLRRYINAAPGKVLNESGEEIGRHPGAMLFTMGERHGFIVTRKTPGDSPLYVVGKSLEDNTITVAPMSDAAAHDRGRSCVMRNISWVTAEPKIGELLRARSRYRQPLQDCVYKGGEVEFRSLQPTLTPGQSLVLYRGDECLGGGVID